MKGEYTSYILIIILMLAVIAFSFILLRKSGEKNKTAKNLVVKGGSISLFFDKVGNLTIIPYVKDKYGNGKATARIDTLKAPVDPTILGGMAKKSLNKSINDTSCSDNEFMDLLGASDWKQFSEGRRNISLYYREGKGLIFNTTTRMSDGAYQFNYNGIEHCLPADVSDYNLGSTILKLLGKCR
jgi:hypothetical protein